MKLIQVIAPHFVAGFEFDMVVVRAAPIIRYMVGWNQDKVVRYCKSKGWTVKRIA